MLRVLVASPSDTTSARSALSGALEEWNSVNGEEGFMLQPKLWERDATPELSGERAQGVINRQLVDDCDMVIGLFWTKLGTPTSEAESGTVEEIERALAAGKPVLLYFSGQPVALDSIDPDEYKRLLEARERFMEQGLVDQFESEAELARKVTAAVTRTIRREFEGAAAVRDVNQGGMTDEVIARVLRAAADIVARIDRFGRSERLVIANRGYATAENLQIRVEVEPGETVPTIALPPQPIKSLPPGAEIDFPMMVAFGDALQWELVYEWTDTSGEHRTRQSMAF